MRGKNEKDGGFLLTEIVAALAILGILLAGLAMSLNVFAKANRNQMVKQRCIAAAQAQLDSITVTGGLIAEEDFSRLWPRLSVSIKASEGIGQWQGMKLVEVTATGSSFGKQVKVELSRYILGGILLRHAADGQTSAEEEY